MPLITQICQIKNTATFVDFDASRDAPGVFNFQKRNLLYGFNGCGKTILSRILAFFGTGVFPNTLPNECSFEFKLSNGDIVSRHSGFDVLTEKLCVYNEDFIERNFNWRDGTADPVQLGAAQVEDVKELEKLELAVNQGEKALQSLDEQHRRAKQNFDLFCKETARAVEEEARLPRLSFRADALKRTYERKTYDASSQLSEAEAEAAKAAVKESDPPNSLALPNPNPPEIYKFQKLTFSQILGATAVQGYLPNLDAHVDQRAWVKHGFDYHRQAKLHRCLFCDSLLTSERWAALAAYFSEDVNRIAQQVDDALNLIDALDDRLAETSSALPAPEQTTARVRLEYVGIKQRIKELAEWRDHYFEPIRAALQTKRRTPASAVEFADSLGPECSDWLEELRGELRKASRCIQNHNNIAAQFAEDQAKQREALKAHLLLEKQDAYHENLTQYESTKEAYENKKLEVSTLKNNLNRVREKLRDHAAAADPINSRIANFLKHKQIQIRPVETGYLLERADGKPINRLSEGEKTAIAFCYFLATLKEKLPLQNPQVGRVSAVDAFGGSA